MSNDSKPGFVGGLLTGLLFGGLAALLLAPKKGQELREDLTHGAETLKDKAADLKEHAPEIIQTAKEKASGLKEHAPEILETAKGKVVALKDEAINRVGDLKASVAGSSESAQDDAEPSPAADVAGDTGGADAEVVPASDAPSDSVDDEVSPEASATEITDFPEVTEVVTDMDTDKREATDPM